MPLTTRLGPRQWIAIDAVVSVAVLAEVAVSAHPRHPGVAHTLVLLLAPPASLPLAVRRRWLIPVFLVVLAASVAYGVLGSKVSSVTGATYRGRYGLLPSSGRRGSTPSTWWVVRPA